MKINRYEELKGRVDKLQRDHDRAEGALSELMGRLKEKHDCKTLKAAENKLEGMEGKVAKMEGDFDRAVDEFEEEWGEALEDGV